MPPTQDRGDTYAKLPDPGQAGTLDGLVERLRLLKIWAGDPSYEWIKGQVNTAWTAAGRPAGDLVGKTTVVNCFRLGRRRLNPELIVAVVQALHPDAGYVTQWRQALQVIGGQREAASQVRVQDRLPEDLAGFTGRSPELNRLRRVLRNGDHQGAVVISAIAGMAGVGKTRLAVHAGHLLDREKRFDRILFVDLRGFHADPAQPPADPAAVLDGFLRLLNMPGQQIPNGLPARAAAYRSRLAGTHTLVVLDNAANEDQVRPLLPGSQDCPVLVTSRRDLTALSPATHLTVDVFTADEALAFLTQAAPGAPVGEDPDAAARIAHRCGHLPLALGLVSAHIRAKPDWTLTDHADRLDERHLQRRLDSGVELALDLSYGNLPARQQLLLRLAALHPGQNLDAHSAAALADTDLATAEALMHDLYRDHLLQQATPGRYTLHDLVRAYATGRAGDEDPPPHRRAALTRLFDYYLATAAAAMDTLHSADTHHPSRIPAPATPAPDLSEPDAARGWLDTERPTLVAVAAHAATQGWPTHTTRLSTTLYQYLNGGHHSDALTVHGHALDAAQRSNDPAKQADAHNSLGSVHLRLARYGLAAEHFQQALALCRQAGDQAGEARAVNNLGNLDTRMGRYQSATHHYKQALDLHTIGGDRTGQARALGNLGSIDERLGHYGPAADHHEQALALFRQVGDLTGEARALNSLGKVEELQGRHDQAASLIRQALTLFQQLGDRNGEAASVYDLGIIQTHLGQPVQATEHLRQALDLLRETGNLDGEVWALNGLGEATHAAGHPAEALTHHTDALTVAADIGSPHQHARAHAGLGHAHHALGDPAKARHHYQRALALYTDLGVPVPDQIRTYLAAIDNDGPGAARPD